MPDAAGPELAAIVAALERGESVVLPTDTVYGLCALASVELAVAKLFELKGRTAQTPIAVLCATTADALDLAADVTAAHRRVADQLWPGPLTLVLRRRPSLAWELGEPADTIGLRVPDHGLIRSLAAQLGPVAATSANRHGEPAALTVEAAKGQLGGDLLVVDAGELAGVPSTVVDATTEPWRVLRAGAISVEELVAAGAPC